MPNTNARATAEMNSKSIKFKLLRVRIASLFVIEYIPKIQIVVITKRLDMYIILGIPEAKVSISELNFMSVN